MKQKKGSQQVTKQNGKKGGPPSEQANGLAPLPVMTDPRFARVHKDPRFIRAKKDANKVKIDQRFAGMLKNEEFGAGIAAPRVDKYGRKKKTSAAKELQRFYKLDDEDLESGEGVEKEGDDEESKEALEQEDEDEVSDEGVEAKEQSDDDESVEEESDRDQIAGFDLARGEGLLESSDEEEGEDSLGEDVDEDEGDLTNVGPYGEEKVPTGDETHRLAVVNLDWDHLKAKDLYKVFAAFVPAGGDLRSVKIYPSEFGKERMEREAREGPPAEIFEQADELRKPLVRSDDGEDFDTQKLRKYQLERLRYYYAIIDCDSVDTARTIYKACDGTEFEKTSNFMDLRYVPDGMAFDDPPSDEATEAPSSYQPVDFVTLALQHSKVNLTWDEDDVERTKVMRRKFTKDDLKDMDFKAYLASDSDDEEDESPEALRAKYQSLLGGEEDESADPFAQEKGEEEGEMEITFAPGLSEKAAALLEKKKEREAQKNETVFESYLRKRKEKKKEKKAQAKKEQEDDEESEEDRLVDSSDDMGDEDDPFFNTDFGDDYEPKKAKTPAPTTTKKTKPGKPTSKPTPEEAKSKAELELLFIDENQTQSRHFDMKEVIKNEKIQGKKKGKKKKVANGGAGDAVQDGFAVDTTDPRFAHMFESHHFAIDPTNPNFKKTQGMEKLLQERRKKISKDESTGDGQAAPAKEATPLPQPAKDKAALSRLVESVKRKSATAMEGGKGKRQKTAKR
ncbi:pre-rRNA-processing protein esf1 [Borealophlyctis nickersoniae]|nr:pre-rRNA-processing protein esf1 [Borealophlyctis nickersoniae]